MIITVHFMESGRHIDSESNIVISNVSFYYGVQIANETDLSQYSNTIMPEKINY